MARQTPPPIDWPALEALSMRDPISYRQELASLPLEPLERPAPVVNPLIKPTKEAAMATPLPPPVQRFEVTEVVPDLSKGHVTVTWCTCGVVTGGARDPRPACPMHSGLTVGLTDSAALLRTPTDVEGKPWPS